MFSLIAIEFYCDEGCFACRILMQWYFLAKYLVVKCCLDNMHYNGLRNTKRITGKNTVILKYIFLIFYCWLDNYKTSNSFKVFICSIIHFFWCIMNISNSMQFTFVSKMKQKKIIWKCSIYLHLIDSILRFLTDLLSHIILSNKTKSFLYQFRSFGGRTSFSHPFGVFGFDCDLCQHWCSDYSFYTGLNSIGKIGP